MYTPIDLSYGGNISHINLHALKKCESISSCFIKQFGAFWQSLKSAFQLNTAKTALS